MVFEDINKQRLALLLKGYTIIVFLNVVIWLLFLNQKHEIGFIFGVLAVFAVQVFEILPLFFMSKRMNPMHYMTVFLVMKIAKYVLVFLLILMFVSVPEGWLETEGKFYLLGAASQLLGYVMVALTTRQYKSV